VAYLLVWTARPWRRWRLPQLNHSERLRVHVFTFSYLLAAIGMLVLSLSHSLTLSVCFDLISVRCLNIPRIGIGGIGGGGGVDIGYSVRWFFLPVLYNHLSKPAILVKCLWLLLTTATWVYIFSMHSRFFYMLWRKWMEQNMDLTCLNRTDCSSNLECLAASNDKL
jgi:hypothetical protein